MIILQTGVPGSGKTASIVHILMNDETYTHFTDKDGVKKQRPLFVNGIPELQIPHQELSDDQIKEQPFQDFLPYGSLVIIDEAQRLMGTRSAAKTVPHFVEALAMHRHHGLDIVLITQHPSFLDSFVRKLVQRHLHISIKPIGRKIYEWNECVDQPESQMNIARAIERAFTLPKEVFGQYKSAEVHTKVRRKLPRIFIFMAFFTPILIIFGWYVVNRMQDKYTPESVQAASAVSAATDPIHQSMPANTTQYNGYANMGQSLTAQMYVPTLPEKPESKPLYDNIRQVRQYERIAGCIEVDRQTCTCYSDQATKLREISTELCKRYVADGLPFDPFRESETQQPIAQDTEPQEQPALRNTAANETTAPLQ